jgi:hypothetical protein
MLLLAGTAFIDGPPPANTGGFGEPTCQQCHGGAELNAPGGNLVLRGLPAHYTPGEIYRLEVVLSRPEMKLGGFQLSARYAEGARQSEQAGVLAPLEERSKIRETGSIQYIGHSRQGTLTTADSVRWALEWQAPADTGAPVVFHVAGNAANGDESQFDDFIYTLEVQLQAK